MASRLSDEAVKSSYDGGLRGVAVRRAQKLPDLIDSTAVDIDELLDMEAVEEAVQAIEPIAMYRAILAKGPSDCLDLLPYLSTDQITRIFDYEAWRDDRLEPMRAINWLMLFNELGPTDMFDRFRDQEEEFQLALLGPMVDLLDEDEFEKIGDSLQDEFVALPCHTLYYRVKSEDPRVQQFVQSLVGSGLESDLQYTYSLLAHAVHVPPSEQEEMLSQFRRARLEEDGFVSKEESTRLFSRIDASKLKKQWCDDGQSAGTALIPATDQSGQAFFTRVLAQLAKDVGPDAAAVLQQTMVHTANMLCTATGTEAGEESQLRDLMYNMQAMISLGLESLSDGNLAVAVGLIRRIHPQELFRTGLSLISAIGDDIVAALSASNLIKTEKLTAYWKQDKRGALVHWLEVSCLDVLGYERLELLKGLFNRFPMLVSDDLFEDGKRRYFQPIISLGDLGKLKVQVAVFIHELKIVEQSVDSMKPGMTFDNILTTAVARACLQGSFSAEALSEVELAALTALDQTELATAFSTCSKALYDRIISVATAAGGNDMETKAVAEKTINRISDLYFDLVTGLQAPTGNLSGIILLKNHSVETIQHA